MCDDKQDFRPTAVQQMAEVRKGQNLAQLGNFASANGLNFEDIAEFYGVNIAKRKCPGISSSNTSNGEQPQEEIEIISSCSAEEAGQTEAGQETGKTTKIDCGNNNTSSANSDRKNPTGL